LRFAAGFQAGVLADVPGARELAALPNGDLLVGTTGTTVWIVPGADGPGIAGTPEVFATLAEGPAAGVAYGPNGHVYVATNTTIWQLPYARGDRSESNALAIAHVRTGPVAPHSDGDVHTTTSIVVSSSAIYAGVGSSCNACVEVDPTRASVERMNLDGSGVTRLATRARNPIALALDPASGVLWIGGAGQDDLAYGHPYEYMDAPSRHGSSNVDYGWPECEEDHVAYNALHEDPAPSCANTVAPSIEFPAYSTLIGAAFYPSNQGGAYAFPAAYRGGMFVTSHGSWHCCPSTPPRVYFVPMAAAGPRIPVNWADPTVQSQTFVTGFGTASTNGYIGRPTGVAVGPNGSLFVADDRTGNILRIRHQ
jgi:glucose/arabinose dehydrogenase